MREDYAELLNSSEWKERRRKVLYRDKFTCQRCGSSYRKVLKTYTISLNTGTVYENFPSEFFRCRLIRAKENGHPGLLLKTALSQAEIRQNPRIGLVVNLVNKNRVSYPFKGSTEETKFNPDFYREIDKNKFLNTTLRKKFVNHGHLDIDLEGIWLSNNDNYPLYKKSKWLQVHHKCYRAGVEIWDQDDDEYITLCNVCHRIIHERELIPYYDQSGRIYQYLAQCDRCSGKGYFKSYKHVQNGTCFKCNGMKLIPVENYRDRKIRIG